MTIDFAALQDLADHRHDSDADQEAFTAAVDALTLDEVKAYGEYRRALRQG